MLFKIRYINESLRLSGNRHLGGGGGGVKGKSVRKNNISNKKPELNEFKRTVVLK